MSAEKTCNCLWGGDTQVQQCTLHQAHVDAIHEWADRARGAEAERDALVAKLKDAEHDRDEFRRVMNGFAEKMAELEGHEPVAWMGFGPRDGRPEFSISKPAGCVMRDFSMRPVFARPDPAEPVNVDFGKRGENMFFNIGNQSFLLDYKPEEQDEFDFMKAMLLSAFSRITHGVKTESQPVNARLLEVLKRLSFCAQTTGGVAGRDDELCSAIEASAKAIAEAEAQQERLLQDMHDAGREIDRVMAEAAPKAARLTRTDIAKALASAGLKPEDYREDGEILPLVIAIESATLRKNGIEVAE